MPMITTTIRSSISVKPLRFIWDYLPHKVQELARLFCRPPTSTNHALHGVATRKQNDINTLAVPHSISKPLRWAAKLRLFATRPGQTQPAANSLPKLGIPPLFTRKPPACRVGNRGGLGPAAARQLEEKLRAQRHALPGSRLSRSIDQCDRRGGVTDTDQEDGVRAIEVTVSGAERIGCPIFAPCPRRVANAGKHRRGRGVGSVGLRMLGEQRDQLRTVVLPRRETSIRAPSIRDHGDGHGNRRRTQTASR